MNKLFLSLILIGLSAAPRASAATIFTPSFTTNFNTSFGANAAIAQAAWISAANALAVSLTDNIHINITVDSVADQSILGQSSTPIITTSYLSLYNAILADATSTDDFTVTGVGGSLGGNGTPGSAVDPLAGGAAENWYVTRAQQKALGLRADDLLNDGTVTFRAGFAYTFSGPIAGGTIDFQGVVLHEITEVMGRIGLSGGLVSGTPGYTVVDAYSFTGAAARNVARGGSFSLDYGSTLLKTFNGAVSGDTRDWASGTNDAFNAFSSSSVTNGITAVDLRMMDAIDYNLASTTPEPSSVVLMSAGLLGLFYARRRRAR